MEIITLDFGTTSLKATRFDDSLSVIGRTSEEYTPDAQGLYVEMDPQAYLNAIKKCLIGLGNLNQVRAVSVTTQGETFIPVNQDGIPLTKAVVWLDARAQEQADALLKVMDNQTFYENTGLPSINGALPICKLMHVKECQPDIYENTFCFLLLEDFVHHYLTGRFVSEKSLQTSTGWFSLKRDDYWDEMISLAGLDQKKLPTLMESGQVVGKILPAIAQEFGLPENVTDVTGAMDQVAAALAADCVREGILLETTGTAMVTAACTENPDFSGSHPLTIYRHAIPGKFIYLPISNTAGMSLKWVRDVFYRGYTYSMMDRLAEDVPPGSNGVVFLPYLAGQVDPENLPSATGCFFGLRLSSGQGDTIRSVLEAIAFQLRDFLKMLSSKGCSIGTVRSLGGGAQSNVWLKIKADACGTVVETLTDSQATSYGAAMLAAAALGLKPESCPVQDSYSPDPDRRAEYEKAYSRYRKLHDALREMYSEEDDV